MNHKAKITENFSKFCQVAKLQSQLNYQPHQISCVRECYPQERVGFWK